MAVTLKLGIRSISNALPIEKINKQKARKSFKFLRLLWVREFYKTKLMKN